MPQVDIELKISGVEDLQKNIENLLGLIIENAKFGLKKAIDATVKDIKIGFAGKPGFFDQTGALRKSIVGGITSSSGNEVTGFISAGDDSIGSNGLRTRDYVNFVEYPELRRQKFVLKPNKKVDERAQSLSVNITRNTSFLRPGTQLARRKIVQIVQNAIVPEKLKEHPQIGEFEG